MNYDLLKLLTSIRLDICTQPVQSKIKVFRTGVHHIYVQFELYDKTTRELKLLKLRKAPTQKERADFYNELLVTRNIPRFEPAVFQELFKMSSGTIYKDIQRIKRSLIF